MPVVWDRAMYERAYEIRIGDSSQPDFGEWVTYGRRLAQRVKNRFDDELTLYIERLTALEQGVRLNRDTDILVVGCGFGYLVEVALDLGSTRMWGTDTSPWIQEEKATEARSDVALRIFDIDITDSDASDQFKTAIGSGNGKFSWIVTEQVVESLDGGTELAPFLDACDALRSGPGGVCHIFTGRLPDNPRTGRSPHDLTMGLQWRTMEEWLAFRPSHYWLNVHGFAVEGGD